MSQVNSLTLKNHRVTILPDSLWRRDADECGMGNFKYMKSENAEGIDVCECCHKGRKIVFNEELHGKGRKIVFESEKGRITIEPKNGMEIHVEPITQEIRTDIHGVIRTEVVGRVIGIGL